MAILSKRNETILLVGGALTAVYLLYKAKQTGQAVIDVAKVKLNPANEDNIVNEVTGKPLARFISGGEHDNLGEWFYCLTHPDAIVCNSEKAATAQALDVPYNSEQANELYLQEREFYEEDVL